MTIPKAVRSVYQVYPKLARQKLLELRDLVFAVAKKHAKTIGDIEETLKWGQPSYLPTQNDVGTTLRLHWSPKHPDQVGIYFHCQTRLGTRIRRTFGREFHIEGDRAVLLDINKKTSKSKLEKLILMILTYYVS